MEVILRILTDMIFILCGFGLGYNKGLKDGDI